MKTLFDILTDDNLSRDETSLIVAKKVKGKFSKSSESLIINQEESIPNNYFPFEVLYALVEERDVDTGGNVKEYKTWAKDYIEFVNELLEE